MNRKWLMEQTWLIPCFLMLILGACASTPSSRSVVEIENTLAAAGFNVYLADSVKKQEKLDAMIQRQIVPQQHGDKVLYTYADATTCNCLYVGNEAAYDRYQALTMENKQAAEQQEAAVEQAELQSEAVMDWGMWGLEPGIY